MYTTEQDRIDAVRALVNNDRLDEWDIDALKSLRTLINDAEARDWVPVESDDDNDGQPDEMQEWHDFDPDC